MKLQPRKVKIVEFSCVALGKPGTWMRKGWVVLEEATDGAGDDEEEEEGGEDDVGSADVGAADVGAADVGAADVGAADVGNADVDIGYLTFLFGGAWALCSEGGFCF